MTIARRINAERMALAGWGRAILLQLAHPLVAAGVADHSAFTGGALQAALRLHHTVRAMTRLTFGTPDERDAALEGIRRIHRRVHGRLREGVGQFPAGTPYSAEDPALVLWVHATLLESLPLVHELFVEPLTIADRDAYCRAAAPLARELGAGSDVPETWQALTDYVAAMHASGQLVVSDDARRLGAAVLSPSLGWLVAPVRHANRVVTTALLPEAIRRQYALPWRASDERAFRWWVRVLRAARRAAPRVLREWPEARRRP
jgi:uncharacterized protein (DUF2236 family)